MHMSLMMREAKRTGCGNRSIRSGSSARRRRHYWRCGSCRNSWQRLRRLGPPHRRRQHPGRRSPCLSDNRRSPRLPRHRSSRCPLHSRCPHRLLRSNCRLRAKGCPRDGRTRRDAYWWWCRPRWFSSRSRRISRQLRAAIHLRPTSAMRSAGWTWAPVAKRWSWSRARLTTWMPAVALPAHGPGIRCACHDEAQPRRSRVSEGSSRPTRPDRRPIFPRRTCWVVPASWMIEAKLKPARRWPR